MRTLIAQHGFKPASVVAIVRTWKQGTAV